MKLLANRHLFSLMGAVIGVLAGIVFSQALVQILDWNWKTIAMINLATIFFVSGVFVFLVLYSRLVKEPGFLSVFVSEGIVGGIAGGILLLLVNFISDHRGIVDEIFLVFLAGAVRGFYMFFIVSVLVGLIYSLTFQSSIKSKLSHPLFISLIWSLCMLFWYPLSWFYGFFPSLIGNPKLITPEKYHSLITTLPIPILLLSAIAGYYIAKALHPSVENWIREREEKKKEFEREKREIIKELEKLIGDYDEKR